MIALCVRRVSRSGIKRRRAFCISAISFSAAFTSPLAKAIFLSRPCFKLDLPMPGNVVSADTYVLVHLRHNTATIRGRMGPYGGGLRFGSEPKGSDSEPRSGVEGRSEAEAYPTLSASITGRAVCLCRPEIAPRVPPPGNPPASRNPGSSMPGVP